MQPFSIAYSEFQRYGYIARVFLNVILHIQDQLLGKNDDDDEKIYLELKIKEVSLELSKNLWRSCIHISGIHCKKGHIRGEILKIRQ